MRAMSRHVAVIYLDSGRDRRGAITRHRVADNIEVVRGVIPLIRAARRRNQDRLARWYVRRATSWIRAEYDRVIFWNAENAVRPDRYIDHDGLIYDCIDPYLDDDPGNRQREGRILRDAAHVFATADLLLERCLAVNPSAMLLNNACDPVEYNQGGAPTGPRPPWLPPAGIPMVAYLGTFDSRVDYGVVEAACRANPAVQFVLAGKVLDAQRAVWQELAGLPNVTAPEAISLEEGHHLVAAARLCLVPFVASAENDGINPMKMYLYALLGRPILATDIRELRSRPEIAETAGTLEEFAAAVGRLTLTEPDEASRGRRRNWAMGNTWAHRADVAWPIVRGLAQVPPVSSRQ